MLSRQRFSTPGGDKEAHSRDTFLTRKSTSSDFPEFLRQLLVSASPAFAWVCVGVPFEVIRSRLQVMNKKAFSGPIHCIRSTFMNEGPRAFWKGVTPTFLSSLPFSTIMFTSFTFLRPDRETEYFKKSSTPCISFTKPTPALACSLSPAEKFKYYAKVFIAGATTGIPLTLFANPLSVWRTRLQMQGALGARLCASSGVLEALRSSKHLLLRGTSMSLVRYVPGNGLFFLFNEVLNLEVMRGRDGAQTPLLQKLLSGGLAGVGSNLLLFPFDVVRSRLMASDTGTAQQVARTVYGQMGVAGFYRGVTMMCLKAFPVNAAGFGALYFTQSLVTDF